MHRMPKSIAKPFSIYSRLFLRPYEREHVRALGSYVIHLEELAEKKDLQSFYDLKNATLSKGILGAPLVDDFVRLTPRFEESWVQSLLKSAEMDMHKKRYRTKAEFDLYLSGSDSSALMLCRILNMPAAAEPFAVRMARAMQIVHLLSDIPRDQQRERTYFPQDALRTAGLRNLSYEHALTRPGCLARLVHRQLDTAQTLFNEAELGIRFVPRRQIPILAAALHVTEHNGQQLRADPFAVYHGVNSPSMLRLCVEGLRAGIFS